uniref:Alpha-carbonic anhydrase domain-containing protein n=1 Tax=Cairina moschata TaxID=8855 RepID=A0A8C3CU72_CAIMO
MPTATPACCSHFLLWFTWPCPPTGPSHWKELKATCGGSKQSPVNIDRRRLQRDSGLGDIVFEGYDQAPPGKWRLVNNGHTVMLSLEGEPASEHIAISGGGLPGRYRALQLHFHWGSPAANGSEHTLDGHQAPQHHIKQGPRCKLLHPTARLQDGLCPPELLALTLQVSEAPNPNYNTIVMPASRHAGQSVDLASTFRLSTLLPRASRLSRYYRYQGSLTTPDCSEAVVWTVFEEPVDIGWAQVAWAALPWGWRMTNNYRPPQPLHSRKVFASRDATSSRGCPGHLLSPLLLLALLSPLSPSP